jgi:subtilisin family serine protease
VAPGVNIYTTHPGGGYTYASGTSDAVSHVSGVVAIIQALRLSAGMDKLTPGEVESILTSIALDLGSHGYDAYYGYGLVDAYRAVLRTLDAVTVTITETITIRQTTTYTVIHMSHIYQPPRQRKPPPQRYL